MSDVLKDFRDDHRNFDQGRLEGHFGDSPWGLFESWLTEAKEQSVNEPNAMSVSTVSELGMPSSRIVYLKEILNQKLVFYTNYLSEKGRNIANNPKVGVLFFWPEMERQIRVQGVAMKVDATVSDAYFASRPRSSQLGAWASHQSEVLASRKDLEDRLIELDQRFPEVVPRPEGWGGYQIEPEMFEFWQGRPSRLHDRILFEKEALGWKIYRKNP